MQLFKLSTGNVTFLTLPGASEVSRYKPVKITKVYVEGLPEGADKVEIRDAFKSFGQVRQVWVAEQQPWVASVYFEDKSEAMEAVRFLDGTLVPLEIFN